MDTSSQPLEEQIMAVIAACCQIEDYVPGSVKPDDSLFGPDSPYGLDSLDAVEAAVAIQKEMDVFISGVKNPRKVLTTLRSIADFVRQARSGS